MTLSKVFARLQRFLPILFDGVVIVLILAFCWFLIGYYTRFEFLSTGYQDWMYHAFRMKDIELHGITSWNNIWSNGINIWRGYQYTPHFITLAVKQIFHVSITKAMIYVEVFLLLFSQASLYIILRKEHIRREAAVLAIVSGLTTITYWGIIRDFSIMFSFLILPLIVWVWIEDLKHKRNSWLLAVLTGLAWSFHPIAGYTSTALWIFSFTLSFERANVLRFLKRFLLYLMASAPFWVPFLTKGYTYASPYLSSSYFIHTTVSEDFFGFRQYFFILCGLCWVALIMKTKQLQQWAKFLILVSTIFFAFIFASLRGYSLKIIDMLQIGRTIPLLVFFLTISIAAMFDMFLGFKSRFLRTILYIAFAFVLAESINVASSQSAPPLQQINNPVALFFDSHPLPKGSVFYPNVSEASYFAPVGIRYPISYNEHMEPHPLAQRYKQIFQNDQSYTGISKKQLQLITTYSDVLGVEYLFVPSLSPIVQSLTATSSGATTQFQYINDVVGSESYSVIRNTAPITEAYALRNEYTPSMQDFEKPTLNISTFDPWDTEIITTYNAIRNGQAMPLDLQFIGTDQLEISLPSEHTNRLLVTQSYDQNWKANDPAITIKPTSLRFMLITLPDNYTSEKVVLTNHWPAWHWPVQALGIVSIFIALLFGYFAL